MTNLVDNIVYTVDRNSPGDCDQGTPIAIFTHKLAAERYARKLNKECGYNIVLKSNGDLDKILNEDNYIYFDTGAFEIDEHVNDY